MRRLFLLLALAAAASAARAQTPGSPAATPSLATAHYSAADTIRAVRHLFEHRIKGAVGYADAGSAVLTAGAVAMALRTDSTSEGQRIDSNRDMLVGSALMGYGVFRAVRFGRTRYEQVVTAYVQGEPLPPYVRRRLKPKYFRYRAF
ncbi:hypothetical protein [Hymenobacter jeollabukensis]|uniref:Uncharacterized protein n=1 Tax=Hymenobacter jeollabukensis TaxID=2025313 RepID=A0A5R8WUG9_9BACT|nr:hypothetical protein [Hymenobacter jeollabukensis]TLM95044.1 hypothetical protein FDY95_04385 [Hymenobacter jeollabukensis]